MKKEKKPLSASDLDQTKKPDLKNRNNLKSFDNKYKDLSLDELKKLFNNADFKKIDRDLEVIVDLLIGLTESIGVCRKTTPNTIFYNDHAFRIKCLSETLEDFAWFEELKKSHNNFFSYKDLQID
jgi:hypothetical protein